MQHLHISVFQLKMLPWNNLSKLSFLVFFIQQSFFIFRQTERKDKLVGNLSLQKSTSKGGEHEKCTHCLLSMSFTIHGNRFCWCCKLCRVWPVLQLSYRPVQRLAIIRPPKIRKAEKARYAKLPLPPGYSWDEISYVIGGANKKARFIDLEGYIITRAKDGSEAKPSTISKTAPGPSITKERKNPINADRAIWRAIARRQPGWASWVDRYLGWRRRRLRRMPWTRLRPYEKTAERKHLGCFIIPGLRQVPPTRRH